jgi:hypothetical protein
VLVLNDYTTASPSTGQPYGVVQAAHEFCLDEGWKSPSRRLATPGRGGRRVVVRVIAGAPVVV